MKLIDSHAHIYVADWGEDQQAMILRAMDAGVEAVIMPHIDEETSEVLLQLYQNYPDWCWPAMGLHPCSVKDGFSELLDDYEKRLANNSIPWKGIGETGLDYYWDLTYKKEQQKAFDRQLSWACELDLPIIIHSRDSLDDCISMAKQRQDGRLKGVFHCFSGNREQVQQINDLGMYIGIGGVATFKNGGLDKVLLPEDLDLMVLETDSPYLAPAPHRGKRNEPAYLPLVVKRLSEILDLTEEEIARTTTANSSKLFSLPA